MNNSTVLNVSYIHSVYLYMDEHSVGVVSALFKDTLCCYVKYNLSNSLSNSNHISNFSFHFYVM